MIIIRIETKLIKKILSKELPYINYKLQYREAKSYYASSDKIIITTDKCNVETVIMCISKYTSRIRIYRYGEISSISGEFNAVIINVDNNEKYEPDFLEFIEVKGV
jgi:hypothetical protein